MHKVDEDDDKSLVPVERKSDKELLPSWVGMAKVLCGKRDELEKLEAGSQEQNRVVVDAESNPTLGL